MLIHAATDNDIFPPLFGGSQRAFGLCRGLARRHGVEALCVVPNRAAGAADETVHGVRLHRRKAWYTSAVWRLERARLAPMFLAAAAHSARAEALAGAFERPADALLADLALTGLFDADPAPLKVHTSHNVQLDHFAGTAADAFVAPGYWKRRLRALEARAVERADVVVVCGGEDAARMRELYGVAPEALEVAPNGYDETAIRPPAPAERARARAALGIADREHVALFVGSDHPHNRAALAALIERVMPPLAGAGHRLLVTGAVTNALGAFRAPWLIARPPAPDLLPALHAADAGVNPVTIGGGSNVKLPTYLAAGLAVISTPFGLRGYESLRSCTVTAAIEDMTEALRARPEGWAVRGAALPAAVADHAWGRIGERLGDALEARLGTRRERRAAGGAA